MKADLRGIVSPIVWDTVEFNIGLIYSGGFITIEDPGYYRAQVTCYSGDNVECDLMANGRELLRNYGTFSAPGTSYGIFYFELFDTVFVRKAWTTDKFEKGSVANYFTIEKL